MKTITYDDVVNTLSGIIDESGYEHQYELPQNGGCAYFDGEAPSCIVGHWVTRINMPELENAVRSAEAVTTSSFPAATIKGLAEDIGITIEPDAVRLLGLVQQRQDAGDVWGNALDQAMNDIEDGQL